MKSHLERINEFGYKRWDNKVIVYFLLFVIVALYSILTYVTPLYIDDWMFMSNWNEHAGSSNFSFKGWWNYYEFTRGYDNGRLSNAFAVFTSLFSPFKEIFPLLNGIAVCLLIILFQRIVCFGTRSNKLVWLSLSWFCCLVFLPWTLLFVADYSLNYIWGGCISLGFLYFILIREKKGWNAWTLSIGIFLSALAGGWHESISIESICGLSLVILIRYKRLSRNFYVIFLTYILFTFCFGFSPGMKNRFEDEFLSSSTWPNIRVLLIWTGFFLLGILLISDKSFRKQCWKILKSSISLCCIGIIIYGYLIAILTRNEPRTFFWPNIGMIILLLYISHNSSLFLKFRFNNKYVYVLISILSLFCIVQLTIIIRIQERYKYFWEDIYEKLNQSENGIVYYNPKTFYGNNVSRYVVLKPVGTNLSNEWQNQTLYRFFRTPFLSIIPEQLKEVERNNLKSIHGNLGSTTIDGFLLAGFSHKNSDANKLLPHRINLLMTKRNGEIIRYETMAIPFIPSINGINKDTMIYINLPDIDLEEVVKIDTIR